MFNKIWFYCFIHILINRFAIFTANPIIGKSYKAKIGEYPFVVSLSDPSNIIDKENHFCGGTLITKKHVLTAAHCIRDVAKNDDMVIVKTLNFNSGKIYKVKSWITYDEWVLSRRFGALKKNDSAGSVSQDNANVKPTRSSMLYDYYKMIGTSDIEDNNNNTCVTAVIAENDIAIITLSQNVEDVDPGKITALHDYELIGKDVVTVGWGSVSGAYETISDSLLRVNMKILRPLEARKNLYALIKQNSYLEPNYYYTSANPPAILGCGDSGGPLMLLSTKEIIGVNKGSCNIQNPQNNPHSMSRHVKLLDKYKEFIEDIKKQ